MSQNTALLTACSEGDLRKAASLLAEHPGAVNASDEAGETALMKAVRGEFRDVVVALLEKGADTTVHSKEGLAAVDVASPELAKLLITKGKGKGDTESAVSFYGKHMVIITAAVTVSRYFLMYVRPPGVLPLVSNEVFFGFFAFFLNIKKIYEIHERHFALSIHFFSYCAIL